MNNKIILLNIGITIFVFAALTFSTELSDPPEEHFAEMIIPALEFPATTMDSITVTMYLYDENGHTNLILTKWKQYNDILSRFIYLDYENGSLIQKSGYEDYRLKWWNDYIYNDDGFLSIEYYHHSDELETTSYYYSPTGLLSHTILSNFSGITTNHFYYNQSGNLNQKTENNTIVFQAEYDAYERLIYEMNIPEWGITNQKTISYLNSGLTNRIFQTTYDGNYISQSESSYIYQNGLLFKIATKKEDTTNQIWFGYDSMKNKSYYLFFDGDNIYDFQQYTYNEQGNLSQKIFKIGINDKNYAGPEVITNTIEFDTYIKETYSYINNDLYMKIEENNHI